MYVTRTLSSLLSSSNTMSEPPPAGPWSGVSVILDDEFLLQNTGRWDSSKSISIHSLPFPQNRFMEISEITGDQTISHTFMMIPVANEPLSSNTYYMVAVTGKFTGQVVPCSNKGEEEIPTGCCIPHWGHARPKPFDPNNIYQKMRVVKSEKGEFHVKSLAYDGCAPSFMNNWQNTAAVTTRWNYSLNEAEGVGLIERLRNRLPELNFSTGAILGNATDYVVVGRWYVPFMFVKELGMNYDDQMRISMFYKMSLEQRWERVFEAQNAGGNLVAVNVRVKSEVVTLGGNVAVRGVGRLAHGVVRFDSAHSGVRGIGLFVGVVERMKWEQARAGWTDIGGGEQRVERVEKYVGGHGWWRFGYYVLVERFALRRMDGSLALTYDFYHTHQVRTKWE